MTGRIVRSTDFERVLRMAPQARSPHFALHHLQGAPSRFVRKRAKAEPENTASVPVRDELSTGRAPEPVISVDDFGATGVDAPLSVRNAAEETPSRACLAHAEVRWLGTVVPKRHAKRSVTRSLMKRQMHAAFAREPGLPEGLWVVRLRATFDVKQFPSAASDVLRQAVRGELDQLLSRLARRLQAGSTP